MEESKVFYNASRPKANIALAGIPRRKRMKREWLILGLFLTLIGCGGGGGGGGGGGDNNINYNGRPVTTILLNSTMSGSLNTSDMYIGDGMYADLFLVTITEDTLLNIKMESEDFSTILFLFPDEVLNEKDSSKWKPLLSFSLGGDLTKEINPGSYIVVATGFAGGFGSYNLTVNTSVKSIISSAGSYVQYRSRENLLDGRFMAWVQFDSNQNINQGDIQNIKLFDPSGVELTPLGAPQFLSENYIFASWNYSTNKFDQIRPLNYSGYLLDLSNSAALDPGLYSFQVKTTTGHTFDYEIDYFGKNALPVVASSSMNFRWETDGSLTLWWNEPFGSFDQYRVHFTDQDGNVIFYGHLGFPVLEQVTLSADLVQQISQSAQTTAPISINWSMRTRSFFKGVNYAQGISNSVVIPWPSPL
jgi:hypothetical protein